MMLNDFIMTDHLASWYPGPVHLYLLIKDRQNGSLNLKSNNEHIQYADLHVVL